MTIDPTEPARTDDTRPRDDRGRIDPAHMTDRELNIELVVTTRALGDALETMGQNPMLKQLMGGKGLFS